MASSSSSEALFSSSSRPGVWRRTVSRAEEASKNRVRGGLLADIDPPPKPWRVALYLACGFIFFFAMLQFLPPTHFRDPSDPLRNWIPFSHMVGDLSSSNEGKSSVISTGDGQSGMMHIVSWMDCLDIQMLAVLFNSTLSSSRYPERIHFHIFTPKGDKDKVSYYKLKVLFPHSSLELIGQEEVKEKMKIAMSVGEHAWPSFHEVAPFLIPSTHPFLKRFIYVSPDIIMKGRIEELFGVNLSNYAVAAAEDCSRLLHEYVNFEILDAIQRSVTKPWVSMNSYKKNACAPDLDVLLINANKLEYDITEAILWWKKVLNKENDGTNQTNPAFVLALYDKYLKLSTTWKVGDRVSSETNHEVKLLRYDGARKTCSSKVNTEEKVIGNLWKQYLPTSSDHILVS